MSSITIYHGSEFIVDKPEYGKGKKYNDYGLSFYCTKDIELAKEWSVQEGKNGYANIYELDFKNLKVLDLSNKTYNALHWITLLLQNRTFNVKNDIAKIGKQYLLDNYKIDTSKYDVIIGYRADDSYFSFAQSFLNNTISIQQLSKVLKLGQLGEQIVLTSKKSFESIKYKGYVIGESKKYYPLRIKRNDKARQEFINSKINNIDKDSLFLMDIVRGGIDNNDPRL